MVAIRCNEAPGLVSENVEAIENRHTRADERRQRPTETRHRDLPEDVAENGCLQQDAVDDPPAGLGLVVVGEQVAGWIRNVARGVSAVMSVLKYAVRKEPVAPVVAAK